MIVSLLLLGSAYNAPPLLLSRRPIASIVLLGAYYTTLPLLFGVLMGGGKLGSGFVVLCLSLTLQKVSVSLLKDYKDEAGDRQYGKQTFLIVYGRHAVAWSSIITGLVGYIVTAWFIYAYHALPWHLAVLLGFGVVANIYLRLMLFKTRKLDKLASIFRQSFIADNYFNLLVLGCLIIS
jgi:4-hydroxybenzoate polyprenyltransferase